MKKLISLYLSILNSLRDLPPLLFRLILAYGFYEPAMKKLSDIHAIGDWFASMGYPAPYLNAYMATGTECLGVICLLLGLGLRFMTIPLMVVMVVAIKTVHLANGFSCGQNGFEVPFYYFFMLFSLLITGAGKFSVDGLIASKSGRN